MDDTIRGEKLKAYLHQIADSVDAETILQEVYHRLALLTDIEASEQAIKNGEILDNDVVFKNAREWLG